MARGRHELRRRRRRRRDVEGNHNGLVLLFIIGLIIWGFVVGGLARLALPGPDPMPWYATIGLALGGSLIGGVRVALVGAGNGATALLQGVPYYKDAPDDEFVPGLMHGNLGGYHVHDIEFTAAFDVTKDKVGKDLADAIWAHPNDTIKFADV